MSKDTNKNHVVMSKETNDKLAQTRKTCEVILPNKNCVGTRFLLGNVNHGIRNDFI